ncbi:transcriptional regulator, TetR family [Promicromonospora thailandica]|uniref:Transcriptional regulator, TetR family n=1 Tax=Promicromonospora thailandica TaxID=765201 RepID=A0A9X2G7L5_9MICO|nr:transcriptional regulator, TetR family [Promicromonospora thailandica]BFF16491.1 TetR/AcrR family transcriptional regulator [Promicromonospora thailandica]BFF22005.1 TetR/AcrR family transcriptional regulator [Promicromonospora thailandica]
MRRPPAERRAEILRIAMETFAERGYQSASLAEIAARVGLTQAGVLHYFSSKASLLTGVLDLRDSTDIDELGHERPRGLAFLRHLVETTRRNTEREGIVRLYTVLAAESVTAEHPAQAYFRDRYRGLLALVVEALEEARARDEVADDVDPPTAARVIVATMDGLQLQWLLEPGSVDMARATEVVIVRLIGRDLPSSG